MSTIPSGLQAYAPMTVQARLRNGAKIKKFRTALSLEEIQRFAGCINLVRMSAFSSHRLKQSFRSRPFPSVDCMKSNVPFWRKLAIPSMTASPRSRNSNSTVDYGDARNFCDYDTISSARIDLPEAKP
jgi:hypothetical protein